MIFKNRTFEVVYTTENYDCKKNELSIDYLMSDEFIIMLDKMIEDDIDLEEFEKFGITKKEELLEVYQELNNNLAGSKNTYDSMIEDIPSLVNYTNGNYFSNKYKEQYDPEIITKSMMKEVFKDLEEYFFKEEYFENCNYRKEEIAEYGDDIQRKVFEKLSLDYSELTDAILYDYSCELRTNFEDKLKDYK